MFILVYFCLPEVDLEVGQSGPKPLHIPPTSENISIFLNLCANSIITTNVILILH